MDCRFASVRRGKRGRRALRRGPGGGPGGDHRAFAFLNLLRGPLAFPPFPDRSVENPKNGRTGYGTTCGAQRVVAKLAAYA